MRPCTCDRWRAGEPFVRGRDCPRCWLYHERPDDPAVRQWKGEPPPAARPSGPRGGPGTELKTLLASFGVGPNTCACNSRAAEMDARGVAWCRENREAIAAHLRSEAARRTWTEKLKAAAAAVITGAAFRLDPLDPFGSLVDEAVRRHEARGGSPGPFDPCPGDPLCGVVIGAYKWPGLIELQIKLIRHVCGPVPVLVSDDMPGSPVAERSARLAAVCCSFPDVTYSPNPTRIGHTGGDLACVWKGVRWGWDRGLAIIAKLSQRLIVTRSRWLQDGAKNLLASSLPLATRRTIGRQKQYPLRTEGLLIDVRQWNRPAVMARVLPRVYGPGVEAEGVIHTTLLAALGGVYWPWDIFGGDRDQRSPDCLWHNCNQVAEYRRLAESMGVNLEPDFHCSGWQGEKGYARG